MAERGSLNVTLVFLYGAGLSSWIWNNVIDSLNYTCVTLDFPGRGRYRDVSTKNLPLARYVEIAREQVNAIADSPIVIVSHSISAVIGLELSSIFADRIIGSIVIGSILPDVHKSFVSMMPFPQRFILPIVMRIAGTVPPKDEIKMSLCSDLPDDVSENVADSFIGESIRLYTDKIGTHHFPAKKLYIQLTRDRTIDIALQAVQARSYREHEITRLESGHMPMLSKPRELAAIIDRFVRNAE